MLYLAKSYLCGYLSDFLLCSGAADFGLYLLPCKFYVIIKTRSSLLLGCYGLNALGL